MGIFGPFTCAKCGRTFYGLNWKIKDKKDICAKCYDALCKEMPYEKWHRMTSSQLKDHFAEKERLDAQKNCSFCEKPFTKDDIYTFVLKDKSKICYSCAESVRIAYPVFCTEEYDSDKEKFQFASDDPLLEMTLEDIPAAKEAAEEKRASLREKYGDHKAVFIVDDVKLGKEKGTRNVWGRTVLGRIDVPCIVCVKRRERPYYFQTEKVQPLEYNKKAESLLEGHDGALVIKEDVPYVYPGDVLVID